MASERRRLPPPTLQGEEYLYAIAMELRDLNDKLDGLLAAPQGRGAPIAVSAERDGIKATATGQPVELREPADPAARPARKAAPSGGAGVRTGAKDK